MKLIDAKKDDKLKIIDVNAPLFLRRRIFDLGCSPNTIISVYAPQRKSTGGIYIVRGVVLGIEKKLAKNILVERI